MIHPCGMCARPCWQCQNEHDRTRADLESMEGEEASLWLEYAEADDRERPAISRRLADLHDVMAEVVGALVDMEEGEWR